MPENDSEQYVVPIISEEVHADATPVQTGGVRVIKRVEGHDEVVEQELRKGRVEVKRVRVERPVDGPQPSRREGNTLIVPVVSEVITVQKRFVVTEEIHITQMEEVERVQQTVPVNHEVVEVQRLDEEGNAISTVDAPRGVTRVLRRNDILEPTERRILNSGKSTSIVKKS